MRFNVAAQRLGFVEGLLSAHQAEREQRGVCGHGKSASTGQEMQISF